MKRFIRSISIILAKQEKKKFTSLVLLNLVISVADIASLAMLLYIINFYTQSPSATLPSFLPGWLFNRDSTLLILLFLILFSGKNYAAYLVNRVQCKFMAQVAYRISQNKLLNYLEGDYADYINVDSAVHIRKISFQPLEYCQHILDGVQQVIMQAVLILLTITAILLFNASLFLLLFVILLPAVVGIFYFIRKKVNAIRTHTRNASEKSLQHLQEALTGFVESNMYGKNDYFLHKYATWQQQYNNYLAKYLVVQGMPARIIEIVALLGLFILITISQWTGITGTNAIVTIGAFMAAAYKIIPGIVKILNISGQMNAYEFTIHDLAGTGRSTSQKKETAGNTIRSVTFKNVHFKYNGQAVLQGLHFSIQQGDFLGISGASGKGKTTILNLLVGFLEPVAGQISINENAADMQLRQQYRKSIAYVKQQPFLLHDSILQNIVLDTKAVDEQKLKAAIENAGLGELVNKFPEKLHKVITENGRNISGGQRQRIALARAFYKDADIILLDEPFNELDEASECVILTHLKQLAANGKLVILITHHSKSLSYCSKTLSLDE